MVTKTQECRRNCHSQEEHNEKNLVHWLGLHASSAGGMEYFPGLELGSCMPYGMPPAPQKEKHNKKWKLISYILGGI